MRQILIDHVRSKHTRKRGGQWARVTLRTNETSSEQNVLDLLALDRALEQLEQRDARLARIVELKVFGGMASGETAAVIGVSTRTVVIDCKVARLWLKRLMAT